MAVRWRQRSSWVGHCTIPRIYIVKREINYCSRRMDVDRCYSVIGMEHAPGQVPEYNFTDSYYKVSLDEFQ